MTARPGLRPPKCNATRSGGQDARSTRRQAHRPWRHRQHRLLQGHRPGQQADPGRGAGGHDNELRGDPVRHAAGFPQHHSPGSCHRYLRLQLRVQHRARRAGPPGRRGSNRPGDGPLHRQAGPGPGRRPADDDDHRHRRAGNGGPGDGRQYVRQPGHPGQRGHAEAPGHCDCGSRARPFGFGPDGHGPPAGDAGPNGLHLIHSRQGSRLQGPQGGGQRGRHHGSHRPGAGS